MDLQNRLNCLTEIDLFQAFSEDKLRMLASNVEEVIFKEGQPIFQEGDPGSDMYILLEGSIKIYKNKRFITELTPIDYLGEMAIIDNEPRSATATPIANVKLLKISAQIFKQYLTSETAPLVSMLEKLSKRIRSDTKLLAEEFQRANILVHDMRNRFSVFLLLDLLSRENLSEEGQRYIKMMQTSCKDLNVMMSEAMANAKRLKFYQEKGMHSINGLLEDLKKSEFTLHKSLTDKNVHLELSPDAKDIRVNPIDIRRVLTNLAVNAGEASPPESDIYISTCANDQSLTITIRDQGEGIPLSIQTKVFSPHFSTKPEGNGLGLASCKDIVEVKHHGTLSFVSTGDGTTFTVTLPYKA